MNTIVNKLLYSMMFCFTCYYLISQSSIVDLSFGNSGKIITDFEQQNDQFESVLFLKIVHLFSTVLLKKGH